MVSVQTVMRLCVCVSLFQIFRKLMSEDSNDFATEYKAVGRKKASTKGAGKRGRPRKSDPVQEDDEMDEDGV